MVNSAILLIFATRKTSFEWKRYSSFISKAGRRRLQHFTAEIVGVHVDSRFSRF